MKHSVNSLPPDLQNEYCSRESQLFRSRVKLYCLITSFIYYAVSLQYIFRAVVLKKNTFRLWELSFWAILAAGTAFCYWLNGRPGRSKLSALIYTGFFLWALSGLAAVYPDNGLVFSFYYAFALLLTSLLMPWTVREVIGLSLLYAVAFTAAYDYIELVLNYKIMKLPRFHPLLDGLIFIGIASFVSVVLRRKEIQRTVHNFALLKELEIQNLQIEKELDLARRVHRTLVPDSLVHPQADIWVSYVPVSYVSGDYAKFRFVGPNRLLVFIGDVTGHGVPAALLVNRVHAEFERLSSEKADPADLLRRLNRFIAKDFEGTHMYLSAFCALLDFEKMNFRYSNYGHLPQYFFSASRSEVSPLISQNTFLGLNEPHDGFEQGEIAFEPGDRLLLFTDGVVETRNADGEHFGEERLQSFLRANDGILDAAFNDRLLEVLTAFRGGPVTDDIFILNVKTKLPVAESLLSHARPIRHDS